MSGDGFTICLWFDGRAEEAAEFYASVFPDFRPGRVLRRPASKQGPAGPVLTVEFELNGQRFVALNGGPEFTFNEAVSLQIDCADQAELDHYWSRLTDGGQAVACGWLKDRFGVSWQVTPTVLTEWIADPDPERAARTFGAMLELTKLDIEPLRRAYEGG
ncbi:VOC family protein [Kitasatospora sp. NPDC096147]|uniref:VOC family protein n=1 Tax=Kitasatospora sp. NPDC096147 TaxID=3364093 RepID=UPI003822105B